MQTLLSRWVLKLHVIEYLASRALLILLEEKSGGGNCSSRRIERTLLIGQSLKGMQSKLGAVWFISELACLPLFRALKI